MRNLTQTLFLFSECAVSFLSGCIVLLFFLFFPIFNGLEQFNYNVTGYGFLPVSCTHSSFGSLDWWVHNFHSDWSIFCCVSSKFFFSSKNFSWIFRDSNHSYIRPFKVVLPFNGAMFIFFFNYWHLILDIFSCSRLSIPWPFHTMSNLLLIHRYYNIHL